MSRVLPALLAAGATTVALGQTQLMVVNSTWSQLVSAPVSGNSGQATVPAARQAHVSVGPLFGRYMLVHGGASASRVPMHNRVEASLVLCRVLGRR